MQLFHCYYWNLSYNDKFLLFYCLSIKLQNFVLLLKNSVLLQKQWVVSTEMQTDNRFIIVGNDACYLGVIFIIHMQPYSTLTLCTQVLYFLALLADSWTYERQSELLLHKILQGTFSVITEITGAENLNQLILVFFFFS